MDGCAKRMVHGVDIVGTFIVDDVEYLQFEIRGAAFLYHQIRKMVGFLAVMMRGYSFDLRIERESKVTDTRSITEMEELISMAFSARYKMAIPLAPSSGLYLKEVQFDGFNEKVVRDKQSWKEIRCDQWREGIDTFTNELIRGAIIEKADDFAVWLYAMENELKFEILEMTTALNQRTNTEGHQYVMVGVPCGWRDGLCHENSRIAHSVQSQFLREVLQSSNGCF